MVKEKREISAFNKIELNGYGTLEINQGKLESLEIETDQQNLPFIVTKVVNKTLKIEVKRASLLGLKKLPKGPITYTIGVKNISKIKTSGSADVIGSKIDTKELFLELAGSGNFKISGNADNQEIKSSGSGNIDCADLKGLNGDIATSGLGKFKVNISDNLQIKISGSGEVLYKGSPKIKQYIYGSGKIAQL